MNRYLGLQFDFFPLLGECVDVPIHFLAQFLHFGRDNFIFTFTFLGNPGFGHVRKRYSAREASLLQYVIQLYMYMQEKTFLCVTCFGIPA